MTYYEILQVSENASDEVIHMAYKALAKKYHPDLFRGDRKFAEEKMKQINAAFEILSDKQKRAQYDSFLRHQKNAYESKTQENSKHQSTTNNPPKSKQEFVFPSRKKSGLIIGILLVLSYIQVWHPYAESEWYDYSFLLGMVDFSLLSFFLMVVPLLVCLVKCFSPKGIKILCAANSISIYIISLVLYICELIPTMLIGWIVAIFYYFINKYILLQISQTSYGKKKAIISSCVIILIIILTFVGSTCILKNTFDENNSINNNLGNHPSNEQIKYESYYVGLRTISVQDRQTAELIVDTWENGDATEATMIELMNQYGAEQGGGQLYLIQPGDYIAEVDAWCFDRKRSVGDVTIIETAYGYTICYFSSVVER